MAARSVRLASVNVAGLAGYDAGDWWVQDLAASLPARLIPSTARHVIDLCAAPGGKTMQLAAAGHQVTAVDASARRLKRLEANLARTQLSAAIVAADALDCSPSVPPDAILLDAPCSATGTFRRHPEVLYRARPSIVAELAVLQSRLLDRAASWLNPGGMLVYATCSLEAAEGEDIVANFLASHPNFAIAPPKSGELPTFVPISTDGTIRILPGLLEDRGGVDGFFIARLVRTA